MRRRILLATVAFAAFSVIGSSTVSAANWSWCFKTRTTVRSVRLESSRAYPRTGRRQAQIVRVRSSQGSRTNVAQPPRTMKWGTHEFRY